MLVAFRGFLLLIAVVVLSTSGPSYTPPLSVQCQNEGADLNLIAPEGAIWKEEIIHWDTVPAGYQSLVGWVNAATVFPCHDELNPLPEIELGMLRIIAVDTTGEEHVAALIAPHDKGAFVGRLFPRIPTWFGETEGTTDRIVAQRQAHSLRLSIGQTPLRVYHGWTNPRLPIEEGMRYFIEGEAKITGTARLQFGMDYWRDESVDYNGWDENCLTSNNCEGWVSDWFGDTHGEFRTFRAPTILPLPVPMENTLARTSAALP